MDVNKGVINQESENLNTKSVILLQTICMVSDGWVLVTTRNKSVEMNVNFVGGFQNFVQIHFFKALNF